MSGPFSLSSADFTLLSQVIEAVARTSGLPPDDADDFIQHAHLRLLERGYAPLALFSGQCSLRTYLTVVVKRLLLDWRNSRFGKWRPSTLATRLGPAAVALDRLITRDGHPVDEAVAILEGRPAAPDARTLRGIAEQLPGRSRVRMVPTDDMESLSIADFIDPIERAQSMAVRQDAVRALRRACRMLTERERRLLHLRFDRRLSVADIAALLGEPAKPLYRQLERIIARLRCAMQTHGTPAPPLSPRGGSRLSGAFAD